MYIDIFVTQHVCGTDPVELDLFFYPYLVFGIQLSL